MSTQRPLPSQAFAREQRRREVGRSGCDDCGVRPARVVSMVGTGAARIRLCSECRMYREIAAWNADSRLPWDGPFGPARIEGGESA